MTKRFVEVVDPYEKHSKYKQISSYPEVRIGDEPDCDYGYDEWEGMMEYYYAYEYTPKSH